LLFRTRRRRGKEAARCTGPLGRRDPSRPARRPGGGGGAIFRGAAGVHVSPTSQARRASGAGGATRRRPRGQGRAGAGTRPCRGRGSGGGLVRKCEFGHDPRKIGGSTGPWVCRLLGRWGHARVPNPTTAEVLQKGRGAEVPRAGSPGSFLRPGHDPGAAVPPAGGRRLRHGHPGKSVWPRGCGGRGDAGPDPGGNDFKVRGFRAGRRGRPPHQAGRGRGQRKKTGPRAARPADPVLAIVPSRRTGNEIFEPPGATDCTAPGPSPWVGRPRSARTACGWKTLGKRAGRCRTAGRVTVGPGPLPALRGQGTAHLQSSGRGDLVIHAPSETPDPKLEARAGEKP